MSVLPAAAAGHDGAPGVVVEPPVVAPGDVVRVHGDSLWTDAPVTLVLLADDGGTRLLEPSTTDGAGHLDVERVIPTDTPGGRYQVIVSNSLGESVAGPLRVEDQPPTLLLAALGAGVGAVVFLVVVDRGRRRAAQASTG